MGDVKPTKPNPSPNPSASPIGEEISPLSTPQKLQDPSHDFILPVQFSFFLGYGHTCGSGRSLFEVKSVSDEYAYRLTSLDNRSIGDFATLGTKNSIEPLSLRPPQLKIEPTPVSLLAYGAEILSLSISEKKPKQSDPTSGFFIGLDGARGARFGWPERWYSIHPDWEDRMPADR